MRERQKNNWFSYAIILTLFTTKSFAVNNWFDDGNRGYWFYEQKPIESIESKTLLPAQKPMTEGEKAVQELEELQKNLKEASALAIMHPTPENVAKYQQIKAQIFDQAGVMADVSVRNNWTNPDSYTSSHATGGEGFNIDKKALNSCGENFLRNNSDIYGMYLFVRNDCKYCNAQIKVLSEAKRLYGVDSMVISTDNSKPIVPATLDYQKDNGIAKQIGIVINDKPVTVLFNAKTKEAKVLGYGYIPIDDLQNRVCRTYTKNVGEY